MRVGANGYWQEQVHSRKHVVMFSNMVINSITTTSDVLGREKYKILFHHVPESKFRQEQDVSGAQDRLPQLGSYNLIWQLACSASSALAGIKTAAPSHPFSGYSLRFS